MNLQSVLRASVCCAAALLVSGPSVAQSPNSARATSTVAARTVNGLIVQMRDAPSHVELARERAQGRAAGGTANAPASDRESSRWQRLVGDLQADPALKRDVPALASMARRDPVGARAQLLRFAQPLTAAQAELVAARLATRPEVESITANTRERRLATTGSPPADPYYPRLTGQWWLQNVQGLNTSPPDGRLRGVPDFLTAWALSTTGSSSAVVAVLDTGITCHPDLGNITANCIGGAILPGYDFVSDDPVARLLYANDGDARDDDPRDPGDWVSADDRQKNPQAFADCEEEPSSWHGTVIAGMVAAQTNNGLGVAAMNWNGRVLPVRVAGKCGAVLADIIEGMRWAAGLPACKTSDGNGGCAVFAPPNANPARIINISFGGSAACGDAYQRAIDDVRAAPGGGAVVVAAAGNDWGAPSRPASCQRVVGVGALNRDGFKTNYSNFGAVLAIATVGGDDNDGAWGPTLADSGVLTIGNDGFTAPGSSGYFSQFGTSFSAPIASGAVSLMLSVNPALSVDQIIAGLKVSARPHVTFPTGVANLGLCSDANPGRCQCTKSTCGAGMLDVTQALYYAANPDGYRNTRAVGDPIDTLELRAAAALGPDRPANPSPPDSGGGGGAMNPAWLLALLLAAWALRGPFSALPPRPRTARSPRRGPQH